VIASGSGLKGAATTRFGGARYVRGADVVTTAVMHGTSHFGSDLEVLATKGFAGDVILPKGRRGVRRSPRANSWTESGNRSNSWGVDRGCVARDEICVASTARLGWLKKELLLKRRKEGV